MEGISVNAYKGIKRYWKRKGYQRLNTTTTSTTISSSLRPYRKIRVQLSRFNLPSPSPPASPFSSHPTSTSIPIPRRRRRRFWRWRVKISPKIRLISPRKWLTRLRDAYINMMLKFANSAVLRGGYGGSIGFGGGGFPIKEYDERVLVEIYKSVLMAQQQSGGGHQVVDTAGKFGSSGHLVAVGR